MKTKSLLLFSLALFLSGNSNAQYHTIGTEWYYGSWGGQFPGVEGYRYYKAVSEDMIKGESYTRISGETSNWYLMEDFQTAYYFNVPDSTKYKLFYFGAQVGDTQMVNGHFMRPAKPDTIIAMRIKVTNIKYIKDNTLDNDSLKEFTLKEIDGVCAAMDYDSIGAVTTRVLHRQGKFRLMFNELFHQDIQDGEFLYLRCLTSLAMDYKSTQAGNLACNHSNLSINEIAIELFPVVQVYPNPSTAGKFMIISERDNLISLLLYDINGRLVKSISGNSGQETFEIETTGMYAGLYNCSIETTAGTFSRKIMIR